MNRKLLAGAAALMLPASLLGVATAGAKAHKAPAATITSVTTSQDAYPASLNGKVNSLVTSSQIAIAGGSSFDIKGTGFGGAQGNGTLTFAAKSGAQTTYTVTNWTTTEITGTVKGGGKGDTVDVTVTPGNINLPATSKKALTVSSNCGPLPASAAPGNTYSYDSNGDLIIPTTGAVSSPGTVYFDVSLVDIGAPFQALNGNLCATDAGFAGAPVWAANYPVTFSGASAGTGNNKLTTLKASAHVSSPAYGNGVVHGIGFSFPYTSSNTLTIYGTTEVYQLAKGDKAAACSADTGSPVAVTTCTVDSSGLVTVTTSTKETYTKGTPIVSPIIKITGITDKASNFTVSPVSATSYIGLGGSCDPTLPSFPAQGGCIKIKFAPRAKSANAGYVTVSLPVSASA